MDYLPRAPKTFRNTNTAWWDASQIYGYDERSRTRVKRDPKDPARLLMVVLPRRDHRGRQAGLPRRCSRSGDPMNPDWAGQEATAFPDNWTIGMSFYHNVFAREHNQFVDEFRRQAAQTPDDDSGLRDPANPASGDPLSGRDARRAVRGCAARRRRRDREDPHHRVDDPAALRRAAVPGHEQQLERAVRREAGRLEGARVRRRASCGAPRTANQASTWYSVLASGPGIFGIGSTRRLDLANPTT